MDEVLLGKAAIIERCLRRIDEEYRGHEDELATNFTRQDSILLNLQRACEASIDAAMHLVRLHRLGIPTASLALTPAGCCSTLLPHRRCRDVRDYPPLRRHSRAKSKSMVHFDNSKTWRSQLKSPTLR